MPHMHNQPHMQPLMNEHATMGPDRQLRPLHPAASGHIAQYEPLLPQLRTFVGQQPTASQSLSLQQQSLAVTQHKQQQENVLPPPAAASNIVTNEGDWEPHVPLLPGLHPKLTALAATPPAKDSTAILSQPTTAQAPQSSRQHISPAPGHTKGPSPPAAELKQLLAAKTFEATRALMLRQQDTFTHQLFGLHCAVRRQAQQIATCRDQASYRLALQKVSNRGHFWVC